MPFVLLSVSARVPVCANLINTHDCGNMVNTRGNHGLPCKRSAGRTLRHNYKNDLFYYALLQAELSLTKEPAWLLRTDGKRPNGLINVPWQTGKSAVWDVTVTDTLD